jgi:hypothetical protein
MSIAISIAPFAAEEVERRAESSCSRGWPMHLIVPNLYVRAIEEGDERRRWNTKKKVR